MTQPGTGGMLSVAEEHIHRCNSAAGLLLCGQEINDETFAIYKADMPIKGRRPSGRMPLEKVYFDSISYS